MLVGNSRVEHMKGLPGTNALAYYKQPSLLLSGNAGAYPFWKELPDTNTLPGLVNYDRNTFYNVETNSRSQTGPHPPERKLKKLMNVIKLLQL